MTLSTIEAQSNLTARLGRVLRFRRKGIRKFTSATLNALVIISILLPNLTVAAASIAYQPREESASSQAQAPLDGETAVARQPELPVQQAPAPEQAQSPLATPVADSDPCGQLGVYATPTPSCAASYQASAVIEVPLTSTEDPAATPPVTETPAPTEETPVDEPVSLALTSRDTEIYAGRTMSVFWEIGGWESLTASWDNPLTLALKASEDVTPLTLVITAPEGFSPLDVPGDAFDANTGTLTLTPDQADGLVRWEVAADAQGPYTFQATLTQGEESLATADLTLQEKGVFTVDAAGGVVTTDDGHIKVTVPNGALTESVDLRIRPPAHAEIYRSSPSGAPIEITATGKTSSLDVSQFGAYITIEISYDENQIWGDEASLVLKYYDETLGYWVLLPSKVDTENNVITGWSNHLTNFDYDINNYEAARLPSLAPFQVSPFTGAATYSMPFEVPAGPGGLQPSLSLSYNSGSVDGANYQQQASWVGMGWSLDTGYIQRNIVGTPYSLSNDTASLVMNGVGGLLVEHSTSGYFHTQTESFWRFEYDDNADEWIGWDKMGNKYTFGHQATMPVYNYSQGCNNVTRLTATWRWSLTEVENIYGKKMTYTYTTRTKNTQDACEDTSIVDMDMEVHPNTITYPRSLYRIEFNISGGRTDYASDWLNLTSTVFFTRKWLDEIKIQHYNGSSWDTIRKYDFTYESTAGDTVYPNYQWPAEGYTLTLVSVQEMADNGAGFDSLPATTFTYGDDHHLTQGENGYGGKATYTYEQWYETGYDSEDVNEMDYNGSTPCNENTHGWEPYYGGDDIFCNGAYLAVDGNAFHKLPEGFVAMGSVLEITFRVKQYGSGTYADVGIDDGLQNAIVIEFDNLTSSFQTKVGTITIPVTSDDATLYINCDGCQFTIIDTVRLTTKYRVTEKRVYANNDANYSSMTYTYDDAATNNYVEFRGHGMVKVENPDGLVSTTYYNQTQNRQGRDAVSITSTEDFWEDMESYRSAYWTATGAAGEHSFTRVGGDNALVINNPNSDWDTTLVRDSYALSDGESLIMHFQVPTGESDLEARFQIGASTSTFGIQVRSGAGTDRYIQVLYNDAGGGNTWGDTLISTTDFVYDAWYVLMIVVDDDDEFLIRVWQVEAPGKNGEFSYDMASSLNWRFEQATKDGTVYMDSYREGVVYGAQANNYSIMFISGVDSHFVYLDSTISWNYDGDAAYTAAKTKYEYNTDDQGGADAGTQFGNLTRVIQSYWDWDKAGGAGWVEYKATKTNYYPDEDLGAQTPVYLVGFPARVTHYKCPGGTCDYDSGDIIAQTLSIYDTNTTYNDTPDEGKMTAQRTWMGGTDYSQTTFGYDAYGNVTATTIYENYGTASAAPSGPSRASSITYETTYYTYATTTTNALSQSSTMTYDYELGVMLTAQGPNGASTKTTATYDNFGRLLTVRQPGDESGTATFSVTYNDSVYPYRVDATQKIDASNTVTMRKYYNGAGQLLQSKMVGAKIQVGANYSNYDVVVGFEYDDVGRAVKQSVPYSASNGSGYTATNFATVDYTSTTYDIRGRTVTATATDGSEVNYETVQVWVSNQLVTQNTVTDDLGRSSVTTNDIRGRVVEVKNLDDAQAQIGPSLTYTYDDRNLLLTATKGTGQDATTITLTYDATGRKLTMDDPDLGSWEYAYDDLGNLVRQEDGLGQNTCMYYDDMNRMTGKYYNGTSETCPSSPTMHLSYTYDETAGGNKGIGAMTSMDDLTGSTDWVYDDRGRKTKETKTIKNAGTFVTETTYNSADLPVTMKYPVGDDGSSREILTFGYHPQLSLDSVTSDYGVGTTTYLKETRYDVAGRVVLRELGDISSSYVLQTTYTYYDWDTANGNGRLNTVVTENNFTPTPVTFQDLTYTYNAVGNISRIVDAVASETIDYTYDDLNRVTEVKINSTVKEEFDYDSGTGVLDSYTENQGTATDYTYSATVPHAATTLKQDQTTVSSYTYDAMGNMTGRDLGGGEVYTLGYDEENRLTAVDDSSSLDSFSDDFEDGTLNAWSSSVTDGGDLSVNTSCSMEGSDCMQALIDDNTAIYVEDTTPDDSDSYNARFLFDPNGLDLDGDTLTIFQIMEGATILAEVQLRYNASSYEVRLLVNDDGGSPSSTGWEPITNAEHEIMVSWSAASASAANDGTAHFSIDGVLDDTITGLDNDTHQVNKVRLGAVQGLESSPNGTMYFDDFDSWMNAYDFAYDGAGNRVRTMVNGNMTIYIGKHYEFDVTNDVVKTYYGGVSMRDDGTMYFLLKDHLGGTSKTVELAGYYNSEIRYTAFGDKRYTDGTTPTTLRYTGQREEEDIGLYYYGARWYDPALGRFTQADTILPSAGNSQAYDRYSYVVNNPINLTDPSGHMPTEPPSTTGSWYCSQNPSECESSTATFCDENPNSTECSEAPYSDAAVDRDLEKFGVKLSGTWTYEEKRWILSALRLAGAAFSNEMEGNLSPHEAFKAVFGVTMINPFIFGKCGQDKFTCKYDGDDVTAGGLTKGQRSIGIATFPTAVSTDRDLRGVNFILHELGHAFNNRIGGQGVAALHSEQQNPGFANRRGTDPDSDHSGFAGPRNSMTWHMGAKNKDQEGEEFADQFVAWVQGEWEVVDGEMTSDAQDRSGFMDDNMKGWIKDASGR